MAAHAAARVGWQVFGIRDGCNGLMRPDLYPAGGMIELDVERVKNIAHLGGTILGTTNRSNPFQALERSADGTTREVDRSDRLLDDFRKHEIDAHGVSDATAAFQLCCNSTGKGCALSEYPRQSTTTSGLR